MQKFSFPYKETEWREIIVILQVPVSNPNKILVAIDTIIDFIFVS